MEQLYGEYSYPSLHRRVGLGASLRSKHKQNGRLPLTQLVIGTPLGVPVIVSPVITRSLPAQAPDLLSLCPQLQWFSTSHIETPSASTVTVRKWGSCITLLVQNPIWRSKALHLAIQPWPKLTIKPTPSTKCQRHQWFEKIQAVREYIPPGA